MYVYNMTLGTAACTYTYTYSCIYTFTQIREHLQKQVTIVILYSTSYTTVAQRVSLRSHELRSGVCISVLMNAQHIIRARSYIGARIYPYRTYKENDLLLCACYLYIRTYYTSCRSVFDPLTLLPYGISCYVTIT